MNSEEFAARLPQLSDAKAARIVEHHGLDPEDARKDLNERFTVTEDLLSWLGY